jgi:hypothetical protein
MAISKKWAVRTGAGTMLAGAMAVGGFGLAGASTGVSGDLASLVLHSSTAAVTAAKTPSGTPAAKIGRRALRRELRRLGFIGGAGKLTAVTPTSITVETQRFGTRTLPTTAKTVYTEAMSVVSRSALKVGDEVGVLVTRPSSTSSSGATVVALEVVEPRLGGEVVSLSAGKIVVEGRQGLKQTIDTTSSTTYREVNSTVPASAVMVGEYVAAYGSISANHETLNASTVGIVGALVAGKVTSVSGSTVTVQTLHRGTMQVATSSSTVFRTNSGSSSLAGVKAGDLILAIGIPNGTSGFTASGMWFGTKPGPKGILSIAFGLGWPGLGG